MVLYKTKKLLSNNKKDKKSYIFLELWFDAEEDLSKKEGLWRVTKWNWNLKEKDVDINSKFEHLSDHVNLSRGIILLEKFKKKYKALGFKVITSGNNSMTSLITRKTVDYERLIYESELSEQFLLDAKNKMLFKI